jgi:hypothetical protein
MSMEEVFKNIYVKASLAELAINGGTDKIGSFSSIYEYTKLYLTSIVRSTDLTNGSPLLVSTLNRLIWRDEEALAANRMPIKEVQIVFNDFYTVLGEGIKGVNPDHLDTLGHFLIGATGFFRGEDFIFCIKSHATDNKYAISQLLAMSREDKNLPDLLLFLGGFSGNGVAHGSTIGFHASEGHYSIGKHYSVYTLDEEEVFTFLPAVKTLANPGVPILDISAPWWGTEDDRKKYKEFEKYSDWDSLSLDKLMAKLINYTKMVTYGFVHQGVLTELVKEGRSKA